MIFDHIKNEMDTFPYKETPNKPAKWFLIVAFSAVGIAAGWLIWIEFLN